MEALCMDTLCMDTLVRHFKLNLMYSWVYVSIIFSFYFLHLLPFYI